MTSDAKLMEKLLRGQQRKPRSDSAAQSAQARETIKQSRSWERGRIGFVETKIHDALFFAPNKVLTTGQLARAVYANPIFDWKNDRLRKKGEVLPKIKSWMCHRIRLAAPTFADRVGGGPGRGGGFRWRLRNEFYHDVRDRKTARDKQRRGGCK